ncbi:MAG: helix-turn-helix transcriptional regulator [Cyclobacteriaceae bacterium]
MVTESIALGQKIKNIRKDLKLTQNKLGELTNTNRAAVNNIERGDQKPPIDFLVRFSEYTGISLDSLLEVKRKSTSQEVDSIINSGLNAITEVEFQVLKEHIASLEKALGDKDTALDQMQQKYENLLSHLRALKDMMLGKKF